MIVHNKKMEGFTLIELMVTLAIFAFLLSLAAPSFATWMADLRVRNLANSISEGVLQARSEAIRINQPVSFQLNSDSSWSVFVDSNNQLINQSAKEFSQSTQVNTNGSNIVTFDGFGSVIPNPDGSTTLNTINVTTGTNFQAVEPLNVEIGLGGVVLVCDPQVTSSTDPRYCSTV
jgi:type IV fimbrial biogenesis protein FimT